MCGDLWGVPSCCTTLPFPAERWRSGGTLADRDGEQDILEGILVNVMVKMQPLVRMSRLLDSSDEEEEGERLEGCDDVVGGSRRTDEVMLECKGVDVDALKILGIKKV